MHAFATRIRTAALALWQDQDIRFLISIVVLFPLEFKLANLSRETKVRLHFGARLAGGRDVGGAGVADGVEFVGCGF